MGIILLGDCKSCNFEKEFQFGGNRHDCATVCMLPAVDKETGGFVE